MKIWHVVILMGISLVAGGISGLWIARYECQRKLELSLSRAPFDPDRATSRLHELLNLTPEQKTAVRNYLEMRQTGLLARRMEMSNRMQASIDEAVGGLKKILDPVQFETLMAIRSSKRPQIPPADFEPEDYPSVAQLPVSSR